MGQTCPNDDRFSFNSLLSFCLWKDCPDDVPDDYTGFRSLSCHFIMSFSPLLGNFLTRPTLTPDPIRETEMRKRHVSLLTSHCPLPFLFSEFMRSPCVEAGLIPPLIQLLNSTDQEVLLQTGRALGNICYDSRE